jgi:hypothetical protein
LGPSFPRQLKKKKKSYVKNQDKAQDPALKDALFAELQKIDTCVRYGVEGWSVGFGFGLACFSGC